MDDLISRAEAIELKPEFLNPNVNRETKEQTAIDRAYARGWNSCNTHWIKEIIEDLPSAQPATNCSEIPNNWIPCSERLPEDEYVLISKKPTKISGDKWNVTIAIRTADPRSRKIQWRDIGFGVIQDDKVLAWQPLPEPYREERTEE